MKFTRDLCRLLGLGSGPHVQPAEEEQMDCVAATSDQHVGSLSQEILNGEEGLSEEEKAKRRAERRRAKRKRQRERKKQELVKQSENAEQDEDEDGSADSELDESESEAEVGAVDDDDDDNEEEELEVEKEELAEQPSVPQKEGISPAVAPLGIKSHQKSQARPSEEEPEWDESSAFFANAASHIRPRGPTRKSKENKENETRREINGGPENSIKRSASLAEKGIKLVQEGQYSQAASMFTKAIQCDPKDYRFFGNRSYCYSCQDLYPQALADAERSIQLAPDWPKGYFRKGSALIGMKRYSEAEKAMEQVLNLDKDCEEAVNDLFHCKVVQLMAHGFEETQSVLLLEKLSTVQAVLSSCPDAARVGSQDSSLVQPGSPGPSLWVGNVTTELTDKHLWDLFKMYGEIDSIRVLHEKFCAFVNFKNATMAARALEKLNGYSIEKTRLVVRYPDRRTQKVLSIPLKTSLPATQQAGMAAGPRRRGPVNGDECYFWRTTGCHFGDKCRYKHFPDQKGKDRKPWQP
ncbi:Tetratricopeptide repeat protein 31 [Merluccius polli]|uniref:Tetratricopeptide repeat protein 31 n=1 Tax=Merluccius polli TaxID=89951 RepID=A0AA47M9V5_MERPO|nr:Tetratricopeptide repeat protein 31 [Merluccius polli]